MTALGRLDADAVCTIRWRHNAGDSTVRHKLALLMRSPSERALDARIAEGHANAATDGADRPITGSAAQSHLDDARRVVREMEERERWLPSAPLHPVGMSPAPNTPPLRSNSILGPLDRQIQEEPDIPPRNPARVGQAPSSQPSAGSDEDCSMKATTGTSSISDAATNPGHNALSMVEALSTPRRPRGREDSRLPDLTGTQPNKPAQ
ncbi:hypothetical protein MBLNU13_g02754t1 [Cladosporium sp. NU13]